MSNAQASLTSAFRSLLENEDFVDVTLCADGKTLKAHKVVLSACSSYFKHLLRGEPISFLLNIPNVINVGFIYYLKCNYLHCCDLISNTSPLCVQLV